MKGGESRVVAPRGIEATRMTELRRVWRFLPVGDERLRNLRSWATSWVRRRRNDDFARCGADALRQQSGVQARRQAQCDDRVTEHRHWRITQCGPAPTRIAAAGRAPVTAEEVMAR